MDERQAKLWSLRHIADEAGCDRSTVQRAITSGKLKAEWVEVEVLPGQKPQRWQGVEPDEAQRWIDARKNRQGK